MIVIEFTHRPGSRFGGEPMSSIAFFTSARIVWRSAIRRGQVLIVTAGVDRRQHRKHRFARVERHFWRVLGSKPAPAVQERLQSSIVETGNQESLLQHGGSETYL